MSVPALLALDENVNLCLFPAVGREHSRLGLPAGKSILSLEGQELLQKNRSEAVAEFGTGRIVKDLLEM